MHPQLTLLLAEARRTQLMREAATHSMRRHSPQGRTRVLRALTYLGLAVPNTGVPTAIVRDLDIPGAFARDGVTVASPAPVVDRELELCRP